MHFDLHFGLLTIILSHLFERSKSGIHLGNFSILSVLNVPISPFMIIPWWLQRIHYVERYINHFETEKFTCLSKCQPFQCIKSAYLPMMFFYRNPLLFLNLINTDVEPNGIVLRTLSTEFVNYYLPMNLLIVYNSLKIVTCTKSFYIIKINCRITLL